MARSGFRNDIVNWSTYQDTQLNVLRALEQSFNTSLAISKTLSNNMSNMQRSMETLLRSANSLVPLVSRTSGSATSSQDAVYRSIQRHYDRERQHQERAHKSAMRNLETQLRAAQDQLRTAEEARIRQKELDQIRKESFEALGQQAKNIFSTIGKATDNLLKINNQIIQNSGSSKEDVAGFRGDIMETVKELNKEIGNNLYRSSESYEKIASVMSGVTNSIDAMNVMSRPLLLASETMNVDIGSVSKLLNRFYTRYSFSSTTMEEILDGIRGNTENTGADPNAVLNSITALEPLLINATQNQEELLIPLVDSVSGAFASLSAQGYDYEKVIDDIYKIVGGVSNWDHRTQMIVQNAGFEGASDAIAALTSSDDPLGFEDAILRIAQSASTVDGNNPIVFNRDENGNLTNVAMQSTAENLGMDFRSGFAQNVYQEFGNSATISEWLKNQDDKSMVEVAADKYVSATDRVVNYLDPLLSLVARMQESLHIGITDIIQAIALYGSAKVFAKNLGRFINPASAAGAASSGAAAGLGTRILGGLETGGFNLSGGSLVGGAATGLGIAAGVGAIGGVAGAVYGGKQAYEDFQSGDTGHGIANTIGAVGTGVGAGALTAGLLGVGATNIWNPVGWISLIAGGATLLGTAIHKAATTVGETASIEESYENLSKQLKSKYREQKDTLEEIQSKLEDANTAEDARKELIKSGILSERDLEKARNSNIDGLKELTESYLKAKSQFSEDFIDNLDNYTREDISYASELKKSVVEQLQNWNDSGLLAEDSDLGNQALAITDEFFWQVKKNLEERKSSGESFDKYTQGIYDKIIEAYDDAELTADEANSIIDKGVFDQYLINSNLGVDALVNAATKSGLSDTITMPEGTFHGKERSEYLFNQIGNIVDKASAESILEELKEKGYSSEEFKEISDIASTYGLNGYDVGTNYVPEDQLALIHEGEAVVPKKYNPVANIEGVKENLQRSQEESKRESQETKALMTEFIEEVQEIRKFLVEWKNSNDRQARIESQKSNRSGFKEEMLLRYFKTT